jgi:hypothetical protein
MSRVMKATPLVILCALIIAVPSAWAYWVPDGVALCTAAGAQISPTITSDGAGGAIVTWDDGRGVADIYAQKVNASGAAQWTANGVALCTAAGNQVSSAITSDGAGGAIIAWSDGRGAGFDIYAQRVNASGAVQWTANGVALCTAAGTQYSPTIIADGAGGAIITWQDRRGADYDIYAQRVTASGDVQWGATGVALCTAAGDQSWPTITSDGAAGAIVTWYDSRGANIDIYAQRVSASGATPWTANGVPLCTAAGDQLNPAITPDGAGGAVVTWYDNRSGNNDIYVQRVNASGAAQWTANGVAVCTAAGTQWLSAITADGKSGAIVTWGDYRSGNYDIYAQKVHSSGVVQWTANGVALCTAAGDQARPTIASDGALGAIVTWLDQRGGDYDIYAQRVNSLGAVQLKANGVALCTAADDQSYPTITSDGAGGAVVTWQDNRSGNFDIYAQSLDANGRIGFLAPSIYSVRDVPGDQGGKVYLSWYGARSDVFMDGQMTYYSLWRAINPAKAALAFESGASPLDDISKLDLSKLDLSSGKPVIRIEQAAARTFFWELIQTVDALYMPAYGKPLATLFDSTGANKEYHYFQVVAHTAVPTVFWKSDPDSGYSVDNIAPYAPAALVGQQSYTPAGLKLTWDSNTEADLGNYHVYRGLTEGFVPGTGTLIASPNDTTLLDGGWRWSSGYYYKVSAIDIHGNESGFALLRPDGVTDVETPKAPATSFLLQNYPNPFNPTTRVAFGLAAPSNVSLRIYDAAGRLVRVLAEGARPAGNYSELWDGRDSGGRAVASGIYFYRLTAGAFTETKKMALLR